MTDLTADRAQAAELLTLYMVNFLQHCQQELRAAFFSNPAGLLQLAADQDFPLWGELDLRSAARDFTLETYILIASQIIDRLEKQQSMEKSLDPKNRMRRQTERFLNLDLSWLQKCSFAHTEQVLMQSAANAEIKQIKEKGKAESRKRLTGRYLVLDPRYAGSQRG